ncbi:MAG: hypothetical protein GC190_20415 [Alphaproteobacteria bacterium]|nr:hypothetical protein [Alphaproteobacteria bacterium]
MGRFDAPELVQRWQQLGEYSRIHDDITHMAMSHLNAKRVMDLCCSTGLLGRRLLDCLKLERVTWVDSSKPAIDAGLAANVIDCKYAYVMRVDRQSLAAFMGIIGRESLTAIVARRCMPELFGYDLQLGRDFAAAIAGAGVTQIFLEGRVPSPNAVNPLSSIDDEVEIFTAHYKDAYRYRNVAVLVKL